MFVIFGILVFSFLVFFHELGHFVAAKLSGVQVNAFSVFMGPALVKWKRGETEYAIRCIPFGGFCAMEGEDEGSDNPRAFTSAKWWKRLIILSAGSFMNLLVGMVLLFCLVLPSKTFTTTELVAVEAGSSLAEGNGLRAGDRILEIADEKLYLQSDFSLIMMLNGEGHHDVLVERNGKEILLEDVWFQYRMFPDEEGGESSRFGITFNTEEATFANKLSYTWNSTLDNMRMVRLSLSMLLRGDAGIKDMAGPVGIVQQMSEISSASKSVWDGILNIVYIGAIISINLAVMNMLPIPALDGGRAFLLLLTTAIEKITKKKIDPKYEGYLHGVCMVLLMILMVVIFLKDIVFLFR